MTQKIHFLIIFLLFQLIATAQKTFQYGSTSKIEEAKAVLTLPNTQGYLLAGYQDNDAYIVKIAPNGTLSASPVTIPNANINAIVTIDATSCYLVGVEGNKAMVRKFNFSTNTLSAIEVSDVPNSEFVTGTKTANGFLFAGKKTLIANQSAPVFAVLGGTSPNWNSTKALAYPNAAITGVTSTANGAVWICGTYQSDNTSFVWNVDNDMVKTFSSGTGVKRQAAFISAAPNNEVYVGFNDKVNSISSSTRIVHLDNSATILQEKPFQTGELTDGVVQNNKLFFTGKSAGKAFLTSVSNDLTLLSAQLFGDATDNGANGIDTTANGQVIAGYLGDLISDQNIFLALNENKNKIKYSIKGRIFSTLDCATTLTTKPLDKWTIIGKSTLTGKENVAVSDETGEYTMVCDTSGTYTLTAKPTAGWETCSPISVLAEPSGLVNVANNLFIKDVTKQEPYLWLDIAPTFLKANEDITYYGEARNATSFPVANAKVEVRFSPELKHVSSSLPATTPAADFLLIDLGTMNPFEIKKFQFKRKIDNPLPDPKRSYWLDAQITPFQTSFKGPRYQVLGTCTGSNVKFTILNTGTDTLPSDFVRRYDIVVDDVYFRNSQPFKNLKPGESQTLEFSTDLEKPIDGRATFTIIVHQGNSKYPNVYGNHTGFKVEACGTTNGNYNSLSAITDLDDDKTRVFYADTLTNTFPLSKIASFPTGIKVSNKNIVLDSITTFEIYDVFKNTDTVAKKSLYLKHTLSTPFELKNIEAGVSSLGDYEIQIEKDNVLIIAFKDINLAQNATGMVAFRLKIPLKNNTDSVFVNQGSLRFGDTGDFTNTGSISQIVNPTGGLKNGGTANQVSIFTVSENPLLPVSVSPNPFGNEALISVPETLLENGALDLYIYDLHGRLQQSQTISQTVVRLDASKLQAGFYFCEIKQNGKIVARGKMVKR